MLANLDFNNFKLVHAKEDEIREIIMKGEFPEKTRDEIFEAYNNFNVNEEIWRKANKTALDLIRTGRNLPYAALRCSSLLNEDNVTFLNVKGISSLITITKKCFASSYNFNNIYYREHNKINHDDIEVAVIVQRMISSEKSGLVYINKETNDIKIEAIHGMCELLLDKAITPNYYSVNKYELFIKDKELSKQFFYITRDEYGNNTKKKLDLEKQNRQVLSDEEIIKIAGYYKKISEYYNREVTFEFGIENSKIYIINVKEVV